MMFEPHLPKQRRKSNSTSSITIKLSLLVAFFLALSLLGIYWNFFTVSTLLDPSTPATEGEASLRRLLENISVVLNVEGEVKLVAHGGNESGLVDVVLTVDVDDLQDFVEDYRNGFVPKPVYPLMPHYVISNRDLCKNQKLDWVIYIHSQLWNIERRQLVRDTWANQKLFKNLKFKLVFLIGQTGNSLDQRTLNEEHAKHGDIVQGDFVDDYKNLTLKAVMGLHWVSTYCPQARFALKADDDSFLNIFALAELMTSSKNPRRTIICPLWVENGMPILRDKRLCMKWCVKKKELSGRTHFPQYCAGIGFIISTPLTPELYEASKSTPFFWIDDVYATGLLARKVKDKVEYVNLMDRFVMRPETALEELQNSTTKQLSYYFVHTNSRHSFITLWNAVLDRLPPNQRAELSADPSLFKLDIS